MTLLSQPRNVPDLRTQLGELIEALDRRMPQLGRAGEHGIAREAGTLRAQAQARLNELDHPPALVTATADDDSPAVCPLCRTAAPPPAEGETRAALSWRCAVCYQTWSAQRLATVAAYAAFCTERRP